MWLSHSILSDSFSLACFIDFVILFVLNCSPLVVILVYQKQRTVMRLCPLKMTRTCWSILKSWPSSRRRPLPRSSKTRRNRPSSRYSGKASNTPSKHVRLRDRGIACVGQVGKFKYNKKSRSTSSKRVAPRRVLSL